MIGNGEPMQSQDATFVLARKPLDRRKRRFEYSYELRGDAGVVLTGTSAGRYLTKGAQFSEPGGTSAFTMAPTRRLAPRRWVVHDAARGPLATFTLSARTRGGAVVDDHRSSRRLQLRPAASIGADLARAMLLVDSGTFTLSVGEDSLATVSAPAANPVRQGWRRLGALMRAVRSEPEEYVVAAVMTWHQARPKDDLEMVAATLLFKDQVVDPQRAPG